MATIQGIYVALFGRPADPLGLAYFNEATNNGADLTAIGDLAATAEYQDRFDGMNNAQIVTAIYQSLFGRSPELAGLEFFVNALNNGDLSINNVAIAILDGAQGADADMVANKVAAADLYTAAVAADADALAAYNGEAGAASGRTYLSTVTADDATVPTEAEVDTAIATLIGSPTVGDTFTLTAGDDFADIAGATRADGNLPSDFRFTDANETVNAASGTLGAFDILLDGSTTDNDVLNVTVGSAGGALGAISGATVGNIENVNVALSGTVNGNFNLSNYTGVNNLTVSGTTAASQLIQITNFAASGVSSIDTTGVTTATATVRVQDANADQDITLNTGAGDDQINLGDGDNVINTGAGNDAVTVGDGNNTIDLVSGVNTVTVGSAAATSVGNNTITGGAGIDTITIQGHGDNVINSGGNADVITINGDGDNTIDAGAGNDAIVVSGDGDNTITAGAGADTINLTGSAGENLLIINQGDSGVTTATADVITAFSSGDDSFSFTGLAAGSATNYAEVANAAASVEAAVTAAASTFDGVVQYVFVDAGANGYLIVDADLDGTADMAVSLVGTADLAHTDILGGAVA